MIRIITVNGIKSVSNSARSCSENHEANGYTALEWIIMFKVVFMVIIILIFVCVFRHDEDRKHTQRDNFDPLCKIIYCMLITQFY